MKWLDSITDSMEMTEHAYFLYPTFLASKLKTTTQGNNYEPVLKGR